VRLDDHVVEQADERVVALLDRPVVVARQSLEALLLERLDELVGRRRAAAEAAEKSAS
jgi:hypothetical protein